jgi:hypothetical protein
MIINMEFSFSNWGKASNKTFELWANILLYSAPFYTGAIAILESGAPKFALWLNFILSVTVITIKALSKFTAETPEPTA